MASGRISSTFYNAGGAEYQFILDWSSSSSTSSNSSTVYVDASLYCPYSLNIKARTGNSITIDGETFSFDTGAISTGGGSVHLASVSKTVYHNSDGSKSISISGSFNVKATFEGNYVGTASASGTATLDNIGRKSSVSATSANIGEVSTITINRASSSFRHTLTYSFGSLTGTIADKTSSASVDWTVPTSFYAQIPNTTSGTATITCTTYSGGSNIGSSSTTITVKTTSASCKPTLSPTVYDSNQTTVALTGDNSKFIQSYSNATYNIGAAARCSATLKSQKVVNGTSTYTTATGTINGVENAVFTFSATDSRNYTASSRVEKTLIEYVKTTASLRDIIFTVNGYMSFYISGQFFNDTFGKVVNTLKVQYRYGISGGEFSDWITIPEENIALGFTDFDAAVELNNLDSYQIYQVQARVEDKLTSATTNVQTLSCMPVFDWGARDFNFNVPVSIQGNKIADFIVEQGTSGMWSYRKWNSGIAEVWGRTDETKVSIGGTWGTLSVKDNAFPHYPYPFEFVENPVVNIFPESSNGNYWLFTGLSGDTTQSPTVSLIRPNGLTVYATINYQIRGRWK